MGTKAMMATMDGAVVFVMVAALGNQMQAVMMFCTENNGG